MQMKNGKIMAGNFSSTTEPFNGVMIEITGEDLREIIKIEMSFEQYGLLLAGRGSVDMKYKRYGIR